MKVFCQTCEKETEVEFRAELYSCRECEQDFTNFNKPAEAELMKLLEIANQRIETLKMIVEYHQRIAEQYKETLDKLNDVMLNCGRDTKGGEG
jgi:uncharacterized Zn finger protein (UPF0148 family)